jgi:two-component system LytT family sensor kinase
VSPALLTERTVLGLLGCLVVVVVLLIVSRMRRGDTSVEDAVLEALGRITKAIPDLREGLSGKTADQAVKQLRELMKCVAVGLTDDQGSLLSWAGEAEVHWQDLEAEALTALETHRHRHKEHKALNCNRKNCPMHHGFVEPLIVEGVPAGALIMIGGPDSGKIGLKMAEEIARFICTQLELAKLDESRQQLAQAEVRALRAQISPHFIFNALNTISSMIRTDPEEARELLLDFAGFARYSFQNKGLFTQLSDELQNIQRYLALELARYGGRLNVRWRIAPELLTLTLPYLVLQPLVENAVNHGISSKMGGGTVTIVAQDYGSEAMISVEDDGVGMDADRLLHDLHDAHRGGAHVGIGNVNQRMKSFYGDSFALMVETAPGAGMKVILRVPKFAPGVRATPVDKAAQSDQEPQDGQAPQADQEGDEPSKPQLTVIDGGAASTT